MTLVVRRFRWWDVERVRPLEVALFAVDSWSAETFWSELAQPATRHYVVAEDGPDLVGYAGLMAVADVGDVQTLAVAPGAQRRGIGRLLLADLLDAARRRGCRAVHLEVRADNERAQVLYRAAGFEPLGRRTGYYDRGRVDALLLRRRLPAQP